MFCKFCGKEIADNAAFCPYCGGKLDGPVSGGNVSEKPVATGAPVKKVTLSKAAKKKLCIEVGIVLFAILAIVMIANGVKKYHQSDAYHVKQCVKEAKALAKKEKYYDAAVKYKEAFAIDETCEEAYVGSAEAFLSIKYYPEAYNVIKQGLSALPDSKNLKKKNEQVWLQKVDTGEKSDSEKMLKYIDTLQEAVKDGCDGENIKKPLAAWYDIMLKRYEENDNKRQIVFMADRAYEILGDKKYKDKADSLRELVANERTWKTDYLDAMEEFMETTGEMDAWARLMFIDYDDIPEMFVAGGAYAMLCTYREGELSSCTFDNFMSMSFSEHSGLFLIDMYNYDTGRSLGTYDMEICEDGSIEDFYYDGDWPEGMWTSCYDLPYYTYDQLCDYFSE